MIGVMVKVRFIQSNVGAAMNASSLSISELGFDEEDRADEQAREEEVRPGLHFAGSMNIRFTHLDRAADHGCFRRARSIRRRRSDGH